MIRNSCRDAGLSVEDRIKLACDPRSAELQGVFEGHGDRIRDDVGADELTWSPDTQATGGNREQDGWSSWEGLIEGEELKLAIEPIRG